MKFYSITLDIISHFLTIPDKQFVKIQNYVLMQLISSTITMNLFFVIVIMYTENDLKSLTRSLSAVFRNFSLWHHFYFEKFKYVVICFKCSSFSVTYCSKPVNKSKSLMVLLTKCYVNPSRSLSFTRGLGQLLYEFTSILGQMLSEPPMKNI